MPDTQVRISASGLRALARQFGQVDREVGKVGRTGGRVGRVLSRQFTGLGGKIGGLKSAVAGLGVAMKARDILAFGDRLGTIQAKAKLSNTEATKLKDQLLALGPAFGVNKDEAIGAAEAFQDYTGVLKAGVKDLELLAKLHKGTATEMKKLAVIDALFIKQGFDLEQRTKGFAALVQQADAGTVALKDMARILPEVMGVGGGFGFTGQRGIQQLGTALQVVGEPLGGKAEESRTVLLRLLQELSKNAKKIGKRKGAGGLGVQVFDEATGGMRNITDIMREIIQATGGKIQGKRGLGAFFGDEALKGATAFAGAFRGGGVGKVLGAGAAATGADIEAMYKRRVEGVAKEFEKVQRGLGKLDSAVQKFGSTILGFALQDPLKTAGVAGGGYAAIKILPAIARFLMKRPAGGGAGGAGMGGVGLGGVQPVFVVNMPGATPWQAAGYGLGPGGGAGGAGKKPPSRIRAAAGAAGHVVGGLVVANEISRIVSGEAPAGGLSGQMLEVARRGRLAQNAKEASKAAMKGTARGLARAAAGGTTTFQTAGGRQALTQENVAAMLTKQGTAAGLSGQELKNAVVAAISEAFKKNPIVVQAKGGLAAPNAQRGRGAQQ